MVEAGRDVLDPRARVLDLLRRHGHATTSFQVLEPGLAYFFDGRGEDEGCVAYVDTGGAWVAAGAPIAPPERRAALAGAFLSRARASRKRACFFAVDRAFVDATGLRAIAIGEDAEWDPAEWPATLRASRRLREQLRRVRAKGVTVRALSVDEIREDHPTRRALDALIDRWLAGRPLAAMGFLVDVRPFEWPEERIYAVAERGSTIVAFLAAVPIYARHGWFVEDLLRTDAAPNGTAELLLDFAFREAIARDAHLLTLGLAPLSGDVQPALRAIARASRGLYNFEGVRAFKARLRPTRWTTEWLAHPKGTPWPFAVHDALRAFATGGFLRFGIQSLRKQRRIVVLVLGGLLLPWTLHVAQPSAAPWIPNTFARVGWIAFHVSVAIALIGLFRRWRSALAGILAPFVAVDAAITIVEVVRHAGELSSLAAIATAAASIAAPMIAASFLWYARGLPLGARAPSGDGGAPHAVPGAALGRPGSMRDG